MAENTPEQRRLGSHVARLAAAIGLVAIGLVAGLGLAQLPLQASSTPAGGTGQNITTAAAGDSDRAGASGHRRAGRVGLPALPLETSSAPDGGAGQAVTTAAAGRAGAAEHAAWLAAAPAGQAVTTAAAGRAGAAEHAAWLASHGVRLGR
jgi:hypothetical protein